MIRVYINGEPVTLSDADDITEWKSGVPQVTLHERKAERANAITQARNAALSALTAQWGGDTWDADEATSARIANALSMVREAAALGIPTPPSIPWRTADNKDRVLTIAELTQMGAAVFQSQQVVWAKQAALKNAIDAAQSVEEVQAVQW
jgi:hypothetical protein